MDERIRAMVRAGLTLEQIAARVGRDRGTVRRTLARHGLETAQMARRRAFRAARMEHVTAVLAPCSRHGMVTFVRMPSSDVFRCPACQSEGVAEARRRRKALLVAEAGGRCVLCGYDRHPAALQFHHVDPRQKRFGVAHAGVTRSLDDMRAEVANCVLLCANCHAEVEAGVSEVA